jgi:hypothetical protein
MMVMVRLLQGHLEVVHSGELVTQPKHMMINIWLNVIGCGVSRVCCDWQTTAGSSHDVLALFLLVPERAMNVRDAWVGFIPLEPGCVCCMACTCTLCKQCSMLQRHSQQFVAAQGQQQWAILNSVSTDADLE